MEQQITQLDFAGTPVSMIRHDGDFWVPAEDIGVALGYPEPRKGVLKVYHRHQQELDMHTTCPKLGTVEGGVEKRRAVRCFNEEGVMIITMLSRQPRAAEFRAWAVQVLKAYQPW